MLHIQTNILSNPNINVGGEDTPTYAIFRKSNITSSKLRTQTSTIPTDENGLVYLVDFVFGYVYISV